MQIEEIKKVIPHRYPFLLVDRVLDLEEEKIIAIKNVTVNEEFLTGIFRELQLCRVYCRLKHWHRPVQSF